MLHFKPGSCVHASYADRRRFAARSRPGAVLARVGIFGAEPWSEGMRDEIENASGSCAQPLRSFRSPSVRVASNIWRLGTAYHLGRSLLSEIIDPQSGASSRGKRREL